MTAEELLLLPRPRSLDLSGGEWAGEDVRYHRADSVPREGYRVEAGPAGVDVVHADAAGRRHADALLDQVRSQCGGRLPCLLAEDHPSLAVRGYMLDVSRDRVPTRATLERLVALLALARFNHLELYVEHTFAYQGEDAVWGEASPLDADDLRWLDAICAAAGIELVANQNTFGHMERWLKSPGHAGRAECPGGVELVPGLTLPPMMLAPTPANAEFAVRLVREQAACLTSRTVNIGCDEVFELGRGASAAAVTSRGKGAVYAEHLSRIVAPLVAEGRPVLFWGDILRSHPDLVATLPAGDLTALAWTYEAPGSLDRMPELPAAVASIVDALGVDLGGHNGFEANVAPFVDAGFPYWVCPGTSSWNSLVGRIDNAVANILDAARVGVARGATGLLLTDWGDNGHLQPPAISFGPIVYAGAVAWCPESNADLDLAAVLDTYVFADDERVLGGALDRLGTLWGKTGKRSFNGSPLQAALCPFQFHFVSGDSDPDAVAAVVAEIDAVIGELPRARPGCVDGEQVVAELTTAAGLARHGAWRLLGAAGRPVCDNTALDADLTGLIEAQEAAWLARSRPGGLSDSLAHLRRTLRSYDS